MRSTITDKDKSEMIQAYRSKNITKRWGDYYFFLVDEEYICPIPKYESGTTSTNIKNYFNSCLFGFSFSNLFTHEPHNNIVKIPASIINKLFSPTQPITVTFKEIQKSLQQKCSKEFLKMFEKKEPTIRGATASSTNLKNPIEESRRLNDGSILKNPIEESRRLNDGSIRPTNFNFILHDNNYIAALPRVGFEATACKADLNTYLSREWYIFGMLTHNKDENMLMIKEEIVKKLYAPFPAPTIFTYSNLLNKIRELSKNGIDISAIIENRPPARQFSNNPTVAIDQTPITENNPTVEPINGTNTETSAPGSTKILPRIPIPLRPLAPFFYREEPTKGTLTETGAPGSTKTPPPVMPNRLPSLREILNPVDVEPVPTGKRALGSSIVNGDTTEERKERETKRSKRL